MEEHSCDLLVIGSGFAGLWAALSAGEAGVRDVAVVDKRSIGLTSQSRMAAGATVYCLPRYDPGLWADTIANANGGLSRRDMVRDMLETSHGRLEVLESWGIEYRRLPLLGYQTMPSRGLEGVRMLVVPGRDGAVGGAAVVGALMEQVRERKRGGDVRLYPRVMITSLLRRDGRVAGAVGVHARTGEPLVFKARAVVLAAADCSFRGGYACVDAVTGDAFRLAYDAGVRLCNMEFLFSNTGSPCYGFEGTGVAARRARFLDRRPESFMKRYRPEGDTAEVCHIVQAMAKEARERNGPPFYFDMSRWPGRYITRRMLMSVGNWCRSTSGGSPRKA
ncbi:MAG: FAD-binding protein [Actinobacteria bacterium]|nr:FAD-binding protein [Actinomycetota bacterium]MBU1945273.1 FAD-binding protein [Actinomycetota bacterium]MBU2687845.1 FAD-binding protein [Actinomycetota bacterium]